MFSLVIMDKFCGGMDPVDPDGTLCLCTAAVYGNDIVSKQ